MFDRMRQAIAYFGGEPEHVEPVSRERLARVVLHAKAVALPGPNRHGIAFGPDGMLEPATTIALATLSERELDECAS